MGSTFETRPPWAESPSVPVVGLVATHSAIFAAPFALIALVIAFPLAYSFWLSLQNFALSVGSDYEFVGAQNYVEALLRDPRFLGSVWNTAVIIVPSLVVELVLGLALALLLSRVAHGRRRSEYRLSPRPHRC